MSGRSLKALRRASRTVKLPLTADGLRPLEPLVGHPALRAAVFGLGSLARNRDATQLLNLPEPDRSVLDQYAAGVTGLPPLHLREL